MGPECNNGIRIMLKKTLYEISGSKIVKQMPKTYIRMPKTRKWTLQRGQPPPKWKKKTLLAVLVQEEPGRWEQRSLQELWPTLKK
jgi:hypothetical protein